jgi:hypothetical protein
MKELFDSDNCPKNIRGTHSDFLRVSSNDFTNPMSSICSHAIFPEAVDVGPDDALLLKKG